MALDAIRQDPGNDRPKLKVVEWFLDHERYAEAGDMLKSIRSSTRADPQYKSHAALIQLAQQQHSKHSMEQLAQQVAANATDLEARYQLGICLALARRYEDALEQFLEIVIHNREFRDQSPRRNILLIFDLLGGKLRRLLVLPGAIQVVRIIQIRRRHRTDGRQHGHGANDGQGSQNSWLVVQWIKLTWE